jgi:AmiR/NasT family two-component response regulator
MERNGISADDAYSQLRRSSRETDTPLRRLAEDITASTRPPGRVEEA